MKKIFFTLVALLLFSTAQAAVELDADSNGATDIGKGGTNATTAAGARTSLGVPATAATLAGSCTVGPCLDGTSDGGDLIKLYGPGGFWTALQAGNSAANRSWRLPLEAPPSAGEQNVMYIDENGQMTLLDKPGTTGWVLSSTDAGVISWAAPSGGISHAASDGNYYASKDGAWASLTGLYAAALGADDNYVTDAEKTRLGDLEAADSVSFAGVTAAGAGGLKAGTENSVRGAITLYSNVNSYAVGLNSAATPTGTWTLTLPPGAPAGANYLFNVDADGTGGWTDPASLGGGYTNLTSFVGQTAWRIFYSNADGDVTELALGSDGEYLKSNGAALAPSWATPSGAAHDAVTLSADLGTNLLGLSTQELTLDSQTANYIFAAPDAAPGVPAFRAMVDGDIPSTIARDSELPTASSLSVDDLITLSGVAEGAVNLGEFTGTTITDNQTNKQALQLLETAVEGKQATLTDPIVAAGAQSITGAKTFDPSMLKMKGSSTGVTTFATANTSASDYTLTFPAETATILVGLPTADNQVIQATGVGTYGWTTTLQGIIDDTAGNGDTDKLWSADKVFDQLALKAPLISPSFTTPTLGVATATSVNKITVTAPATGATLTLVEGSTLATAGAYSTTLTATGATNVTLPTTGTLATQTWAQQADSDLDTWATVTPSANGQSLVAAANYAAMRTLLDLEADTDFAAYGKNPVVIASKAADYTIGTDSANELFGGTVYVTSTATITIPAVAVGQNFSVVTIGDIAVHLDPNAVDKMILDGVTLADGDKATNSSKSGDTITCQYYSADGFYCWSGTVLGGHWTDGN